MTDITEIVGRIEEQARCFGEAVDLELEAAEAARRAADEAATDADRAAAANEERLAAERAAELLERQFVDMGAGCEAFQAWQLRQGSVVAEFGRVAEHYKALHDAAKDKYEAGKAAFGRMLAAYAKSRGLDKLTGENRIRTDRVNVGFYASGKPAVKLDEAYTDARLLPSRFRRTKIEVKADLDAIRRALEGGEVVAGAELVRTNRPDVRLPTTKPKKSRKKS